MKIVFDNFHQLLFQLHHTGIKTQDRGTAWHKGAGFQLHHTGIKTTYEDYQGQDNRLISIAPYRN